MDGFFMFESQMPLLNNIIQSTNQLMPIIYENTPITETIHDTIDQIFLFIDKILVILPEMLLSENGMVNLKKDLLKAFSRVIICWKEITIAFSELKYEWEIFLKLWNEFIISMENITNGKTILISMN
jgi:hypothetical protein